MKKKLMVAVFSLALLGGMKTTDAKVGDRIRALNLDGHRLKAAGETIKKGAQKVAQAVTGAKNYYDEHKEELRDTAKSVKEIAEIAQREHDDLVKAGVISGDHQLSQELMELVQKAQDLSDQVENTLDTVDHLEKKAEAVNQAVQSGDYKSAVYTIDDALRERAGVEPTLPSYEESTVSDAPPAYTP